MPTHSPPFITSFPDFLMNLYTTLFTMAAPLKHWRSWSPFRLDALGLLTMLGADEMSREIGSLSANTLVSWMSLLGGNVVPSDAFVDPLHGYTLYNISDAIQSTSLAGWFSRWLLAQHPSQNTSLFVWSTRSYPRHHGHRALAIGTIVNTCILALSLLVGDYYGLASALCMDFGIIIRAYLVAQNRDAIDRAAADTSIHSHDLVRTFIILANGKATTVIAPRNVVVNCFLSTPKIAHPTFYAIARAMGWFAFVGLIVTVGQAVLVVQIAIIIVTVSATVLTAFGIGTVGDGVGKSLQVARSEHPNRHGRRGEAYAMLHLNKEEEDTMIDWALFPQRRNQNWWNQYRTYKAIDSKIIDVFEDSATEGKTLKASSFRGSTLTEEKSAATTAKVQELKTE
ncbi:hypothetical protein HO173_005745 [Letharia columbiana]|uniref:Uncharacterized protein n=1 Tax=Letharia columbiana TaxID=112416 RepID=A0A8H6FWP1_9LECA|nr:uncharacterized protein HO173_005745 [Letharia columbiana]KAF6236117.1 hypothetical protein HO173_005745 [Letharia columbiana]